MGLRIVGFCVVFFLFYSCEQEKNIDCGMCGLNMNRIEEPETPIEAIQMSSVKDTSTQGDQEFLENKAKIEKKFGEQWDFCNCVILNDSLNKQIKAGNIDDKIMKRMEDVDKHCKAFLVMDGNKTPEDRENHEKKVQKCLKAAGIRN